MPTPPDTSRRSRPVRARHVVAGCLVIGAAVAALDRYYIAERHRQFAAQPSDPSLLAPPDPAQWRGTPLRPGTPAPTFTLADARNGAWVSLDDFRGGRPVVLLLSSFG